MATIPGTSPTPRTFKQKLLVWIWNLINAIFGGVGVAGAAVVGGAATGAATFTPRQLGVVVVGGAIVATFNYLRTNRLPELFDGGGSDTGSREDS